MAEDKLSLISADGTQIDFDIIATIYLANSKYLIVLPCTKINGIEEDEALVYRVTMVGQNKAKYDLILDDNTLDKVFDEYEKLLDKSNEGEK